MMPPPDQSPITPASILAMIGKKPRRRQFTREKQDLLHPSLAGKDSYIQFPFRETLWNSFEMMCNVPSIGLRENPVKGCYTYLKREDDDTLARVLLWQSTVGQYVAIRDCLALSFALDFEHEDGDPNKPQTRIGALRYRAKTYDRKSTDESLAAADLLVQECLSFLQSMTCYGAADAVVAMPPSRPDKPFDLPRHLAKGIAIEIGKADLSHHVVTVKERKPLKETILAEKLGVIQGTIAVGRGPFQGCTVLLVDDLYQSGISMNYVAMELLKAGARAVLGLACEKTCRNDDNMSHSRD
jgi:hypothetical protein